MHKKLELKILALVGVLLLIGISVAGLMVMTIEKKTLYRITEISTENTANIIMKDVERTMIEGRADLSKALLKDLKGNDGGVEEIILLNHEGREAFNKGAPGLEADTLKRLVALKTPLVHRDDKKLTYYKPLLKKEACKTCHSENQEVLGAVKITFSLGKEYAHAMEMIAIVMLVTIISCICFSIILWLTVRRLVIKPLGVIEKAAEKLSDGDMTFEVGKLSEDEIGRFSDAVKGSLHSISNILLRIKEVFKRVTRVTESVEIESKKVVECTILETEAINDISASIEEMNAVISDIAEGTDSLAASTEQTAASMEEMASSIALINHSTTELATAVEANSASIEEISATIKEVANNAEELAAAAEETQSAIIEISTSVKEVESRAKESAVLSDKVKHDAITFGMVSIEKTIKGMQDIQSSVERTAVCITKLGGRSEEIGNILNVIDEVTDQTTMLALNAAILAAQAGEHGKGFSVVADEIKELAEKTSMSTQEIALLIQSVQQEVSDAINAMNDGLKSVETGFLVTQEAADALRKIVESSKKSSEMAAAIDHSTSEQSKAVKLVSDAMETVLHMVGQIAKATTEQSRGIQLIMQSTEKMRDVAGHVKNATNEQSLNSKQVSQAIELVSDKSHQISRAINEQKIGSNQIWMSVEKIKDLPRENKERAFRLNQLVKQLMKDSELAMTEMERFTLAGDSISGILRMGVVPLESPAVMFKRFSPLTEYLSGKLQRKVELKVAVDFQGAVEDIGQGTTQFCFMTPSTYIEAHKKYGVSVLVSALRDGKPFQHSVIVTRNDSLISNVEDIKGHSFAFGDPHSTSSHIVPRGMLLAAGIDIKDLLFCNYLGHHDDVANAVLKGDFDAGAIMESTALKYRDKGLKLVKYSDDIPEFNICVASGLDHRIVAELKNALSDLNTSTPGGSGILKAINESYTGFAEISDREYQKIRTMMETIGLL